MDNKFIQPLDVMETDNHWQQDRERDWQCVSKILRRRNCDTRSKENTRREVLLVISKIWIGTNKPC
jgi:hypothetical protein